ncbi:hypothetical protein M406DRAFT_102065 [Cryphonectria parasitica EP155]|uniref:Uncharacterized protein n=1 Tax=Cryphonectria parasitica (strain ATCC 38755 / EP155) TaxID=660469 RepID=A0A9P5CS18_CRYP1|nr:uncharacterized protein M406DRAFT_102065 [Cryphonectria parasitica EP155]KAF3767690.1 hypothetical protein M406DRAFT_102065 [Cryphonectria parasitica EP155]
MQKPTTLQGTKVYHRGPPENAKQQCSLQTASAATSCKTGIELFEIGRKVVPKTPRMLTKPPDMEEHGKEKKKRQIKERGMKAIRKRDEQGKKKGKEGNHNTADEIRRQRNAPFWTGSRCHHLDSSFDLDADHQQFDGCSDLPSPETETNVSPNVFECHEFCSRPPPSMSSLIDHSLAIARCSVHFHPQTQTHKTISAQTDYYPAQINRVMPSWV